MFFLFLLIFVSFGDLIILNLQLAGTTVQLIETHQDKLILSVGHSVNTTDVSVIVFDFARPLSNVAVEVELSLPTTFSEQIDRENWKQVFQTHLNSQDGLETANVEFFSWRERDDSDSQTDRSNILYITLGCVVAFIILLVFLHFRCSTSQGMISSKFDDSKKQRPIKIINEFRFGVALENGKTAFPEPETLKHSLRKRPNPSANVRPKLNDPSLYSKNSPQRSMDTDFSRSRHSGGHDLSRETIPRPSQKRMDIPRHFEHHKTPSNISVPKVGLKPHRDQSYRNSRSRESRYTPSPNSVRSGKGRHYRAPSPKALSSVREERAGRVSTNIIVQE